VSLGAAGTQPAQTNAQGQVTFSNVAAGSYVASISGLSADFACPQTSQPVVVAGGQQTSVTFACNLVQTASITGSVSTTTGAAHAGASITITRTAPAPAGSPVTVTTGTNGQYSLAGLRSGTYSVVLAVTANCTTAATTQNVTIAAGEARVVNFTCTVAPPPPPQLPATAAIESITATGPFGQQVPVPDNAVLGLVNVNVDVSEGDQRVTRVELWLGNQLVGTHTRTVAAPEEEMQLADFEVTFTVQTAAFNATTGAPNYPNAATFFEVRVFTAAGGATNSAATGRRTITLQNVNAVYVTMTPQRKVIGGTAQSSLVTTTGQEIFSGDATIAGLPVVYSGETVTNVVIRLGAFSPLSIPTGDEDDVYSIGNVTDVLTRAIYMNAVPFESDVVTRTLTAAPWSTTLLAANSITAGDNDDRGVGNIEDVGFGLGAAGVGAFNITVSSSITGGVGPTTPAPITSLCADGRIPSPVLYPPPGTGCANGQPAQSIRWDTFAPLIDQMDQSLRWSSSFAAAGVGVPSNGVSRWISEGKTFSFTTSGNNSTTPRTTDRLSGTTGTYWTYRWGRTTGAMTAMTSAASYDGDTFDNNVFYLNASVMDIAQNERTIWNNNTSSGSTGSGTGDNSIASLELQNTADGLMPPNGARHGRDTPDPCFTRDGVACADDVATVSELRATGGVIGPMGGVTIGGGGTFDGTLLVTQRMDPLNSAGGDPGFPPTGAVTGEYGSVITFMRREFPGLSQTERCWVGVISNNNCVAAGASGSTSGTNGSFLFANFGGGVSYSTINATSGAVTVVTNDRAGTTLDMDARADLGVGFYNVQYTLVDGAGNQAPMTFRRYVRDMMAPIAAGVIFPVSAAPGAQITVSSLSQDDLALWKAESFLAFTGAPSPTGAGYAFKQNETNIMAFPTGSGYNDGAPYTTNFNPSATFRFSHTLAVGAGGGGSPATNVVFRIFDHGRNVVEASSTGVPAMNPAPPAAPVIASARLEASVATVCWDADGDGCTVTTATSSSLSLTITGPATNPFNPVEFYVGRDVDNDGAVDLDASGREMWTSLGAAGGSAVGGGFVFTRVQTGQQLANAAGLSTIMAPANLHIRVVGYTPTGHAFTVGAGGPVACVASPGGADASCTISIQLD
jgi:hypothetical protein